MLYADNAYIGSRLPQGLKQTMASLVGVFGAFGLTVSEKKIEPMDLPISHAPATGQQYHQTTAFTYLGGMITERPKLSTEIRHRIGADWMSFNRYRTKLYDRPHRIARLKGPDGEARGSQGPFVRMHKKNPAKGRPPEALRLTPQDAASDPWSRV